LAIDHNKGREPQKHIQMNPNTTVFDNVSQAPTAAERVLNLALVALKRADFLEVMKHF
jgi:hypothetical protein